MACWPDVVMGCRGLGLEYIHYRSWVSDGLLIRYSHGFS
jgi:hypothetical protein